MPRHRTEAEHRAAVDRLMDLAIEAMLEDQDSDGDDLASAVMTMALRMCRYGMALPNTDKTVIRLAAERIWAATRDPNEKVM